MTNVFVGSQEVTEWYDDAYMVMVQADNLHIWVDEKHYTSTEPDDEVNVGDKYLYERGYSGDSYPHIVEVTDLIERDSETYAVFGDGEEMHVGFLLGEPMQMGQMPPPTRLKQVE